MVYYNQGWLAKRYYDGKLFHQPYSCEDRLWAGKMLYEDYMVWRRGAKLTQDYTLERVDKSLPLHGGVMTSFSAERFRRAIKQVNKAVLPVVYKIVLSEERITAPKGLSKREQLYFNDEIKGLLCRGLDELCQFYRHKTSV